MSDERVQDLPRGWLARPLSDIAQINPPLDRCVINDHVVVTFIPMRAVEADGKGLTHPEERQYGDVKKGYRSFLSDDVIMAKITPCMENGKVTVVPEVPGQVCFGSTEFHSARPEQGIQPRWIAYFLLQHHVRRAAQRTMTGGVGQMRVPASWLESLGTPVAPAAEQERIADALDELFSDLDAAIAALAARGASHQKSLATTDGVIVECGAWRWANARTNKRRCSWPPPICRSRPGIRSTRG